MKDWWHSPQRVTGMWPEWFGPVQPDWPGQVRLTGFGLWDERGIHALPAEMEAFIDAGDPPIAFTPGSAMFFGHDFFEQSAQACGLMGRRGILLSRHREHIPGRLPPGVAYFPYAPFSELLPRCAAIVHHAGIGTTAQGLAAGVPQLLMPMSHDQFDNADRLCRLHVGAVVPRREYRAARVAAALEGLMSEPHTKKLALDLAKKVQGATAIEQTCDLIEGLLPDRSSHARHDDRAQHV
jgi:UDP:flavonoid glycosyltransferase YjiC (YdhE family)